MDSYETDGAAHNTPASTVRDKAVNVLPVNDAPVSGLPASGLPVNKIRAHGENVPERDRQQFRRMSLTLLTIGLVAILASVLIMNWDPSLSQSIRIGKIPGDVRKAIELSEAFAHGTGVAAILAALLLATRGPRSGLWGIALLTATSGGLANVLKALVTRARPYTLDEDLAKSATDITGWQFLGTSGFWDASHRSFPSGHTATAWALALGLSLLYPRAMLLFFALATLATYQRLYSGAHYPSDTLAGFAVACITGAMMLAVPRFQRAVCTARN